MEELFQQACQGFGCAHHHHLHGLPSLPGHENTRPLSVYAERGRVVPDTEIQFFPQGLFSLASSYSRT